MCRGWAKEWTLGCVNPTSWLPLADEGEFTQPRAHSFAQPVHNIIMREFGAHDGKNKPK